ncbi:MAG: polysaccharide biosynthesis tyrosine autokinase [Alphaproteobacteria bacterium]|nr:polysaccharide biosynthesis tyrosine autokinase [Alphaproteobacteria bacterium]MCW5738691.1 polysaccharide biosynthesis tyrosine autokinase [Alphaproteobacteria bacterium]
MQLAAPEKDEGLLETLRRLWRQRRIVLACAFVFAAATTAVALSLPSRYVAEARVLVGIQGPRAFNIEAAVNDVSPDAERVQNEGFILQSRILAKQVIERLRLRENPEFNPPPRQPAAWTRVLDPARYLPDDWMEWLDERRPKPAPTAPDPAAAAAAAENRIIDILLSRVDVSTLGRSHVLSVRAESENPATAASLANVLAEVYLETQRQEKIASMGRVEQFLMNRITELREQVRRSDEAVEDYRREHGLYKSASSGSVTAQQLSELNTQLLAAQTAKVEAEARLREARELTRGGQDHDSVPDVLRSPLIASLKQAQAAAERKAAELSASYGERHPMMRSARADAANIAARVRAEIAKTIDGLAREARQTAARYESLNQNFERLKKTMGTVNNASIQLEALERDAAVNRSLLEAMLQRAKQAIGIEDFQQANAKLVSPASPPVAPSYPPKMLIVFVGTLAGLMAGAAIALLREGSDRTFRRADQVVSTTGLPVMSVVPHLAGRTPAPVHVLRQPVSAFSEALRRLHIGLELSEAAESPRTVLFSSAAPAEGKSVMVASLGRLMASNGKRVLLIDCDWRCPRLHQTFRCSNRVGLANVLGDKDTVLTDAIHHDTLSGVDVMPAGNWNPRQSHLISSDRMRHMLAALEPDYDSIILDTPPVLVGAEVLALSRLVSKVVFVVRWGHTRREAVLEAIKQIFEAQGDVAGVVLSRVVAKQYRQYAYGTPLYDYPRPATMARIA